MLASLFTWFCFILLQFLREQVDFTILNPVSRNSISLLYKGWNSKLIIPSLSTPYGLLDSWICGQQFRLTYFPKSLTSMTSLFSQVQLNCFFIGLFRKNIICNTRPLGFIFGHFMSYSCHWGWTLLLRSHCSFRFEKNEQTSMKRWQFVKEQHT